MGGSSVSDDWEVIANEAQTILMIGCRGEGKSATNNSIHGRNAFQLRSSSGGVTRACEIQRTRLEDGKILDVIDTPGFDFNVESVLVVNEIDCSHPEDLKEALKMCGYRQVLFNNKHKIQQSKLND
ncbi:hypothetical protein KY285_010610 [Solanum tuberosum]|nr:hypothetical protein KY285_010610 [Solanum tuberosum]